MKRGSYKEFVVTLKQVFLIELCSTLYLFSAQIGQGYSRIVLYLTGILYLMLTFFVRIIWKFIVIKRRLNIGKSSLIVVTTDDLLETVIENAENGNYGVYKSMEIAVINKDMEGTQIGKWKIVANRENVAEYICREWVDEVLIHYPEDCIFPKELNSQFIEMGVVIHKKLAEVSYMKGKKQFIEKLGDYTVLTTSINYTTPGKLLVKRLVDIIGGVVGCIITGILFLIFAPIIKKESPGPVFFAQERVGLNGKKFKIFKFRSMYVDAEKRKQELQKQNMIKDGRMFKLEWDPRVIGNRIEHGEKKTGVGDFMRKWSLDEFPQFFNVLKGDMSLVGTRPPTVDEWEKYERHHRVRLAVKPGITGMWQICGRSNIDDFEEVVRLDKQYITSWSIGLDFKILLKTIAVVLKKEGAM